MTTPDDLPGILRRMDAFERNQSDQARQITAHNAEILSAKERIAGLEAAHQDRRVSDAEEAGKAAVLLADVASMKADIASIKGTFGRALWVFVSAIIVAFATFLIRGGFAP